MLKLSIITVNYNNLSGLIKTFDSIKSQKWKSFEYIVIDGGSTDGSKEEIISNTEIINYWVSEADKGVYHAMNKGIKASKGEYLIFMNSGDVFFDENVLGNLISDFDKEYGFIYGNTECCDQDGNPIKTVYPPHKLTFRFLFENTVNHQATFIKRDLFDKYFLYNEDYKICSDWEFLIYSLLIGQEPYKHVDLKICKYDLTGMSSNPNNIEKSKKERMMTLDKYFSPFLENFSVLDEIENRGVRRILYIKKFKKAWKVLKFLSKIVVVFLPKPKNKEYRF